MDPPLTIELAHSMEEADALADRAGIMAKRMLAVGTSDALRKKHGDAYHVHLVHKDAPYTSEEDMDIIKSFIRRNFERAEIEDRTFHGQLRFSVPNTGRGRGTTRDSTDDGRDSLVGSTKKIAVTTVTPADGESSASGNGISALFAQLEANKEKLGCEYYSVSQATLDQVFLSIVTKHNVQEENHARAHPAKGTAWSKVRKVLAEIYHSA